MAMGELCGWRERPNRANVVGHNANRKVQPEGCKWGIGCAQAHGRSTHVHHGWTAHTSRRDLRNRRSRCSAVGVSAESIDRWIRQGLVSRDVLVGRGPIGDGKSSPIHSIDDQCRRRDRCAVEAAREATMGSAGKRLWTACVATVVPQRTSPSTGSVRLGGRPWMAVRQSKEHRRLQRSESRGERATSAGSGADAIRTLLSCQKPDLANRTPKAEILDARPVIRHRVVGSVASDSTTTKDTRHSATPRLQRYRYRSSVSMFVGYPRRSGTMHSTPSSDSRSRHPTTHADGSVVVAIKIPSSPALLRPTQRNARPPRNCGPEST